MCGFWFLLQVSLVLVDPLDNLAHLVHPGLLDAQVQYILYTTMKI